MTWQTNNCRSWKLLCTLQKLRGGMRRELESRVEAVARDALGSRALQVRVLRGRLGACQQLAECIPSGGRLDVLLGAQVRSSQSRA